MVIGAAHRAGVAKPVDLDRRGAAREHAKARFTRVAVHVDQNIDLVIGNDRGGFVVIEAANVGPVFGCGFDALIDAVICGNAAIIDEILDDVGIMRFEQVGHQIADGVGAQIR